MNILFAVSKHFPIFLLNNYLFIIYTLIINYFIEVSCKLTEIKDYYQMHYTQAFDHGKIFCTMNKNINQQLHTQLNFR